MPYLLSLKKRQNLQSPSAANHNIFIGNDYGAPLGCCGPLRVMLGCQFIPRLQFRLLLSNIFGFSTVLFNIEPQQCKFYASMMKLNLLNVQRLLLSSFMA